MKNLKFSFGVLLLILLASFVVSEPPAVCTRCAQSNTCKPPDCFCCREDLQLPIPLENIPQIVFFTFDDAVTDQVAGFYRQLFDSSRKNPNGCPVTMTLFVSHDNTKYRLVQEFHEKGMEIASHSVTHSTMNGTNFFEEAKSQKENIAKLANIPVNEIKGWRSPFLKPTGDLQPDSLKKLGYSYDATLTFSKRSFREKPPGPFTLDFGFPYECQVKPCPRNKHPGFWEVPVVSLMDYQHKYDCVYVDGCMNAPPDEDAAFQFLWDNFHNYYTHTRMPFGINMHPSWFFYPDRYKAMDRFIQKLVSMNDVYIVSASRMLEWLKRPTPLQDLRSFTPWACDGSEKTFRNGGAVSRGGQRSQGPRVTSWGSRVAGSPRRFFTPRVMYPAMRFTPAPPAVARRFTPGNRESLRSGIFTLTAQELEGRPAQYPANIQNIQINNNIRHRQRMRDQNGGWQNRVSPSMIPRIATISLDRRIHNDMGNNRVENLPNVDMPSPRPSAVSQRETLGRRDQFIRQQSLAEQQRKQVLERIRQRRIQRLQQQRHRDLVAQQNHQEHQSKQQEQQPQRRKVQKRLPTLIPDIKPSLSSTKRKEVLDKRLQQTILWKPTLSIEKKKKKETIPTKSTMNKKTTPAKIYQETVKVWPLFTKAPTSNKMIPNRNISQRKTKPRDIPKQSADELNNFIQKVESQTNTRITKAKPIPTQVPARQSTRPVWVKTRPPLTPRPLYTPTGATSRRTSFTIVTPSPRILESPLERQQRLQAQHFRRANETIRRQREREERIRRQQVQELRQKQRAAVRINQMNQMNQMQPDFNRQFVPPPSLTMRSEPIPLIRTPMINRPVFRGDVLHPSVAQRLAWNRFIRQMLRNP